MQFIEIEDKKIQLTEEGFLADLQCWTEPLALALAALENIILTTEHWRLIHFLRKFYAEHDHVPPLRVFIKAAQIDLDSSLNSIALHKLFPDSPMKFLAKLSGLPKPKHCM